MKDMIEPEGAAEHDREAYVTGLDDNARKDVRTLLSSGAGEAEAAEYIASLGPEPDDAFGPPEGQSPPAHYRRI